MLFGDHFHIMKHTKASFLAKQDTETQFFSRNQLVCNLRRSHSRDTIKSHMLVAFVRHQKCDIEIWWKFDLLEVAQSCCR